MPEEIYEWADKVIKEVSSKRFEENLKFVFKLAFKKLKNNLLRRYKISFYSKKFDFQFYEYYFGETAKHSGIDIEHYFDPLNSRGVNKTLNSSYFKLIFQSEEFKRNFLIYVKSGQLLLDYQANLKRKITQLLMKFDYMFSSTDPLMTARAIASVERYFRKNKQCKLPWLCSEIIIAIKTFELMVNSL